MDYKEEYNKALERAKKGMPIDEVFPELKESDDERIRKGMLEAFKHSDLEVWSDAELRIKDIITWLEKHKEQNPAVLSDDFELALEQFLMNADSSSNTFAEDIKKYANRLREIVRKEQNHTSKPKIYDSMDDLIADALIEEIEASELSKSEKHNRIYWINKHRQKPAEKSSMLKKLREHLANTPREQLDAEFEALKDLTIDKPAEWSEEDEQFLLVCKNALQKYQSSDKWDAAIIYNWLEKRLKSLNPHWKPSEVEMDALKDVIDRELLTCRQQVPLESLYKELKKL